MRIDWLTIRMTAVLSLVLLSSLFLSTYASMALAKDGPKHDSVPKYKPSSRAPEPLDIRTNAYGFSRSAPQALGIGDTVPDFSATNPQGQDIVLAELRAQGPVVIVFYRGHW